MTTRTPELSPDLIARIRREVGRLAPAHEVDDLAQEACARIIEKEDLWRQERGALTGWVTTVARNVVRNRWRQQAREHDARAMLEEKQRRQGDDPFSEEKIRLVLEQFARLPDDEQRLLRWRYLEEQSVTEIALKLAVSQPTATRRIQDALAALQRRAHAKWLSPTLPLLRFLGVHKMKIAAAAAITALVAASATSWFDQDPDAAVVGTTASLPHTTFVAGLSSRVDPTENVIWCATGPLAWKELETLVGGPVKLDRASPTVDLLNGSSFDADQVSSSAFVAGAGLIGDGVIDRLQRELKRKFKRGPDPVLARAASLAGKGQLLTYAFLYKQIEWQVKFESLEQPLAFRHTIDGKARESNVRAFGIRDMGTHQYFTKLARQVRVFGDTEAFAVELSTPGVDDRVILARIPASTTLDRTVKRVLKLTSGKPQYLAGDDTLQIPVLDFDLAHVFSDVNGNLENRGFGDKALGYAMQTVRLRLDEKGALLKSRFLATAGAAFGHQPRRLIFDRPFLLLMKEKGRQPYLAVWVASPEILVVE